MERITIIPRIHRNRRGTGLKRGTKRTNSNLTTISDENLLE